MSKSNASDDEEIPTADFVDDPGDARDHYSPGLDGFNEDINETPDERDNTLSEQEIIKELEKIADTPLVELMGKQMQSIDRLSTTPSEDADQENDVQDATLVAYYDYGPVSPVPPYQEWTSVSPDPVTQNIVMGVAGFTAKSATLIGGAMAATAAAGPAGALNPKVLSGIIPAAGWASREAAAISYFALKAVTEINGNLDTIEHNINATIDRINHPQTIIDFPRY
ncbi:MAG: hypothetical protein JJ964_10415 [Rhizobiales bacterium]|nr:hypothetical protein [Hyphomicrobiales bacterium]